MTTKFSAKEIHFLKTDSDDKHLTPPLQYYGDVLLNKTAPVMNFEKRLSAAARLKDSFVCAVLQLVPDNDDLTFEKAGTAFENTFTSLLDNDRGIWEALDERSFVIALHVEKTNNKTTRMIKSLVEKLGSVFNAAYLAGISFFPFHDFDRSQTFANALKAVDHAAFFGPGTIQDFDATSINIHADRLFALQEYAKAIRQYETGLTIEPGNANLMNSLGVCFGVMDEQEKAKEYFKKAMDAAPQEPMSVYNFALVHYIEGDLEKAVLYLRKARSIRSDVFEVELLLGQLLVKQKKTKQALTHLETASRLNPESGMAFRLMGEIFLDQENPKDAAVHFNTAIKRNPSDAVSLSGYAKCLELRDKNLNIALSFAKNSVAIEPDNIVFRERLAVIREKIDNIVTPDKMKSA